MPQVRRADALSEPLTCPTCGHKQAAAYGKGEDHPNARLKPEDVLDIRARHAEGEAGTQIAASYEISKETVYGIVKRRTWKHI
jgi:hypothetical protein